MVKPGFLIHPAEHMPTARRSTWLKSFAHVCSGPCYLGIRCVRPSVITESVSRLRTWKMHLNIVKKNRNVSSQCSLLYSVFKGMVYRFSAIYCLLLSANTRPLIAVQVATCDVEKDQKCPNLVTRNARDVFIISERNSCCSQYFSNNVKY